jgi:uncharacterized protein (TIGR02231 family)
MDIALTVKVTEVTVYTQQARVTVHGEVKLETGTHRLIVEELPLSLDTETVRVGGFGSAQVRLYGVDIRRHHYEETPVERVHELELAIESLEDEILAIDDEDEILQAQERYLEGLRDASEQYARGLALGRTSVEKQGQISQFFLDQDLELRASGRALALRKRELERKLDKARRELDQFKSSKPRQRNQAIIELDVVEPGDFRAEIVYNVHSAFWRPLYDIKLEESEAGHFLQLTGIAQISQSSGQDWVDVDLKVSTARPELGRQLPELKPWYIDVYQPPVPRAAPVEARVASAPQAMSKPRSFSSQSEPQAEKVMADIAVEQGGASVTYVVVNRANIPSDNSPHKTVLFEIGVPATVDYVAIPKYVESVYRRVKVKNNGDAPLLAGSTHLFVGERYIGNSKIDYVPVGDELELTLGAEERLSIERELVRREVDKARLRDKRQTNFGYRITIKNLMAHAVKVEVHDHIPVAKHEDIKVKLVSCTPSPTEQDDLNLMEWHLKLDSGTDATVYYEYQVEHPRSLTIMGLQG